MLVYLRDKAAQAIVCAIPRQKLKIILSISSSHSIVTLGQPLPALALHHQAPGRVVSGKPILKSLAGLNWEKSPRGKQELNSGLNADTLTTRPTGLSLLKRFRISTMRLRRRWWMGKKRGEAVRYQM